MYVLNNWPKLLLAAIILGVSFLGMSYYSSQTELLESQKAAQQLDLNKPQLHELKDSHRNRNTIVFLTRILAVLVVVSLFFGDLKIFLQKIKEGEPPKVTTTTLLFLVFLSGCYRPFEPVKLEVISSTEEAFLLPYLGDPKNQSSSDNEEFLMKNLVYTQQVKIPQQWVPKGFETFGADGNWTDAAVLIKVDKQSVTREWTADPNSGTSNKNEAIWVMTSDQVEFSTGWSITAMIASREDAVTFLHRYRNGSLKDVLDNEVRAKLATTFGLEVTDLPMDTLRKEATPHIKNTVTEVTTFFKERGITITNLGITGGFVYKDKSVQDQLVKVFNSEQEVNIAKAKSAAQEEANKMTLAMKKAEADGIKAIAEAKFFELEKTRETGGDLYMQLKWMELAKEVLTKWDGKFPHYYFGTGVESKMPQMLMNLPSMEPSKVTPVKSNPVPPPTVPAPEVKK